MVLESVWGNATAALGKETKEESEREGEQRLLPLVVELILALL